MSGRHSLLKCAPLFDELGLGTFISEDRDVYFVALTKVALTVPVRPIRSTSVAQGEAMSGRHSLLKCAPLFDELGQGIFISEDRDVYFVVLTKVVLTVPVRLTRRTSVAQGEVMSGRHSLLKCAPLFDELGQGTFISEDRDVYFVVLTKVVLTVPVRLIRRTNVARGEAMSGRRRVASIGFLLHAFGAETSM